MEGLRKEFAMNDSYSTEKFLNDLVSTDAGFEKFELSELHLIAQFFNDLAKIMRWS